MCLSVLISVSEKKAGQRYSAQMALLLKNVDWKCHNNGSKPLAIPFNSILYFGWIIKSLYDADNFA